MTSAIKLGRAIKALSVSANSQMKLSDSVAPKGITKTQSSLNHLMAFTPSKYCRHFSLYRLQPMMVVKANTDKA